MQSPLSCRAFSLMEMAIVLAVSGLMFSFVLSTVQGSGKLAVNCVMETKTQMQDIRGAVEKFARKYDRLPLPAARNIASDHVQYGREASGADIDAAAGVSFGALPWQALGLTSEYAGDCWGHKYTYAVTTALTTDNSSGGFKDSTVLGNITLKKDGTNDVNTQMAYAIISHGEDALGAVKLNWTEANPTHGWCTGSTNIGYTNCLATAATLIDATYNNGKDAGANYFDDIVVAAGKPKVVNTQGYYAYGWGDNTSGHLTGSRFVLYPKNMNSSLIFTQVAASLGAFTCGRTAAGAVYCWGANNYGQFGNGTTTSSATPVAVSGGYVFADIVVGQRHACGRTAAGAVYCWGGNNNGQLGDNSNIDKLTPTLVSGTFAQISTAGNTTCGLNAAGTAYCWGYNGTGGVGNNSTTNVKIPTLVSGGLLFSSISSGYSHTCALQKTTNKAYCWGYNNNGQIGNGNTTTPQKTPQGITGYAFTKIATSALSTCAILASTNAAYCWGNNTRGQLGNGNNTNQTTPVAVSGGLSFSSIYGSMYGQLLGYMSRHCGITITGDAYCWGDNQDTTFSIAAGFGNGTITSSNVPVAVGGGMQFTSMSLGASQSCGISQAGETYCWGADNYGETGSGTARTYRFTPSPMEVNGKTFTQIYNNGSPTEGATCGTDDSGAAYCWGYNVNGQLGNGTTNNSTTPVAVSGGHVFSSISMIFSGVTCGLDNSGAAYCWGQNSYGQFGDGTTNSSTTPVAVSGGHVFSSIEVDYTHACGLDMSGAAYCWGDNTFGQFGDGTTNSSTTPVAVSGGHVFSSIALGNYYTCGIDNSGAAYCWGQNISGQLGDNTTNDSTLPVAVTGGYHFSTIKAGSGTTCALTSAGAAYCWGSNWHGLIGDGTGLDQHVPTLIAGYSFTSIEVGNSNACALTSAGVAYCWGYNTLGEHGTGNSTEHDSPVPVGGGLTFKSLFPASVALLTPASTCTDLWSSGTAPNGLTYYAYQSAAPTGHCVAEYRTCSSGSWSGSYTQQTCTPGCDSRTISWTVGATTCTATMPAQAGGANVAVPATAGGTGSVNAACSTSGVVTLSGGTCT